MTTVSAPVSPMLRRPAPRSAWFGPNMPVARFGLIVNLALPMLLLAWDAAHGNVGPDGTKYAIHTTGLIAIVYLLASLVVTPLRQVTRLEWLTQFRRSLGVYAFYYAAVHLAIYFWFDRGRSLSDTAYEITHRYYLTIGFASLVLMAPLWASSFNVAIQWMGGRNWKRLHRLAYVAAYLAGIHFWLQSKSYKFYPNLWLWTLNGLILWRVGAFVVHRLRRPATPAATTPARFWKGDLRVVAMTDETPNVRTFRLAPTDGGPVPFAFSAGQFLNLKLNVNGREESRSYTIASPPTRRDHVELTVKREAAGRVSHHLHHKLMTGDTVAISAPAGRFTFDPDAGDTAVLLIAGGVGITPVMSILRDLTDRRWPGRIDLVFSVRTPEDVIFDRELDMLSARHPNVDVHRTFTRTAPPGWTGPSGRITAGLLRTLVPDFAARRAFVCGPDAMAHAVRDELIAAGVDASRITLESFTPAATPSRTDEPAAADGRPATLTFGMSGMTASIPSNKTVLDVAERVGVRIDYQCRSGICGTCRCRLLAGTVHMTVRDALSDADAADGYILACQAYADGNVTVDA